VVAERTIDVWQVSTGGSRATSHDALRAILSAYVEHAQFSLSRSGDRALVAVCERGPVGVDIERINEGRPMERIAARMFAPDEALLSATPGGFYRCWTAKEAYAKGLGLGLGLAFTSFSVAGAAAGRGLVAHSGHGRWEVEAIPVGDGYAAALAAPAGPWRHELRTWEPA
jgi:4'-phosphopantetheinyl transferase